MSRLVSSLAALIAASALAAPVSAADWQDDFRSGYPSDWDLGAEVDPLDFELGLRYWYSMGAHRLTLGGDDYSADDTSHILEGHFRIDDRSTNTYAKGFGGYSAAISGTYSTPEFASTQTMQGGKVAYVGADLGWMPLGSETFRMGGFAGYQYWNESPDMGRASFTTSSGGGDSEVNNLEINALRLGLVTRAELGDMFDLNAEVAAIPYAGIRGTYGAFFQGPFVSGGTTFEQGSAGTIEGWLYGAAAEVMLGVHPTENFTIRAGARAWYLTGPTTMTFTAREDGDPSNEQDWISDSEQFSLFRWGPLLEVTYAF